VGARTTVAAADALPTARPVSITVERGTVVAGGHTVLDAVSLHIPAGQHVAIVGASGAGKSSLVGLLLGWHTLAEGRLLVNGQAISPSMLSTLRHATAWVDPAVQLWNRPLLDNLVYASDDDGLGRLAPVIEAAGLRDVMRSLPQGLRTPLGEGGARLSGGQAQRVRLARAFLQQRVRLAVLDEPFRGLDRGQRAALLDRARRWWQPCTLLCVTHDVSETQQFDRVLVLDGGRIVEDGTPAELAARGGAYSALLQAEDQVRRQMWQGTEWRHLRMDGGQLRATLGRIAANAPFAPLVRNKGAVPVPPPAPWSTH
jgi:ATP-binding cassette subfamily B protein